jgi:hypothetical protein
MLICMLACYLALQMAAKQPKTMNPAYQGVTFRDELPAPV